MKRFLQNVEMNDIKMNIETISNCLKQKKRSKNFTFLY